MGKQDRISRAALAVIFACAGTLALTSAVIAAPMLGQRLGWLSEVSSYRVGDLVDVPASAYAGATRTVVLFVRSGCGACLRAKPSLARLVASATSDPSTRVVVITGLAHEQEELQFAEDLGVSRSQVIRTDLTQLRVTTVPTVVVVDTNGKVLTAREAATSAEEWESILMTR